MSLNVGLRILGESRVAATSGRLGRIYKTATLLIFISLLACTLQGCASHASGLNVQFPDSVEIPDDPMAGRPRLEFSVKPLTPELLDSLANSHQQEQQTPSYPELENSIFEYRISPFDVLQITVWDHPELTVSAPVAASTIAGDPAGSKITGHLVDTQGNIFFPYVGEVNVANKTIAEVRRELTEKLSKYIPSPQLDVRVSAYRSKRVFVLGQVANGGTVKLDDSPMRILDAIDMSEGVTEEADLRSVKLIRDGKHISVDLAEIYFNGNLQQNYVLKNNDVIHVPDSDGRKVYMIGEFRQPGTVRLRNHQVTLADAMSSVDGLNENTANAKYVLILRMVNETEPVIYLFNANVPEHLLLSTQFIMEPYDIVYVPPTGLTQWSRMVKHILPTINSISRLLIGIKNILIPT